MLDKEAVDQSTRDEAAFPPHVMSAEGIVNVYLDHRASMKRRGKRHIALECSV